MALIVSQQRRAERINGLSRIRKAAQVGIH